MKNRYEVRDGEVLLFVKDKSQLHVAKCDQADLLRVQEFPGTWYAAWIKGKPYVQGKQAEKTISLHRWITETGDDRRVHFRGHTLDCRRENLEIVPTRRSYARSLARRQQPSERFQYARALARQLAERAGISFDVALRGIQRDGLRPELQDEASRIAGEGLPSLPGPPRLRAGWEHRLPGIFEALESSSAELIFRRDVETLFQVSRKTAVELLDRFGAAFYGAALAVPRRELVERLRQIEADPDISFRINKHRAVLQTATHDSLRETLGDAVKRLAAGRPYLEGREVLAHLQSRFEQFPESIQLTKSELRVQFDGYQSFVEQLGIIIYALQNDAAQIETFLSC